MPASIESGLEARGLGWIAPDWPAPAWIRAGTSTRMGGVSPAPYDSLNLGFHVGDAAKSVVQNRQRLADCGLFPNEPLWLNQVHGVDVVSADGAQDIPDADASYSHNRSVVCAVMTADCLPVLLCDRQGRVVAAAHAGWRGLVEGVLEATVTAMGIPASQLMAWLGPAIGPQVFEVGDEVRAAFLSHHIEAGKAFKPSAAGRWLADIYQLARIRLNAVGVTSIYGGHWCTYTDKERFFSYRRDGVTGRMASCIWMAG